MFSKSSQNWTFQFDPDRKASVCDTDPGLHKNYPTLWK